MNADFSLEQMASDFNMTPSALCRYYQKYSGTKIFDYLSSLKMDMAKKMLMERDMPVYEIGLLLGYQGQNSFIRRFKAVYGITPGKFREENAREVKVCKNND